MEKRIFITILAALLLLLVVANYSFLDSEVIKFIGDSHSSIVERVIDGDTVVLDDGTHIRMLGMNAPETTSKEKYSEEAKQYLKDLVENKSVRLESSGKDLYGRTLAYIFLRNENVNEMLVREGLANPYFPEGSGNYQNEIFQAWNTCLKDNIGICTKSTDRCGDCIKLTKLDVSTQEAVFYNSCSFSCDLTNWQIKDEGRKEFNFPDYILYGYNSVTVKVGNETNTKDVLYWPGYSYVWTRAEDTLFLRDTNKDLVLWKRF
jgi:micrococcal nuclease